MSFDPANDPADSLYVQIKALSADVKSLNAQLATIDTQRASVEAARNTKLGQLLALRDQIQIELTGVPVQS